MSPLSETSFDRPGWKRLVTVSGAIAACLAAAAPAWAGPPFLTDDPEPVDLHHWEFYLASIGTVSPDNTLLTAPHVEINYGLLPNTQVHLIAPMAYGFSSGAGHYGYGDTELGVKYRFLQEGDRTPQAGVFPLAELPTGNAAEGLGSGQLQVFLPVWLQKSWGDWTSYGGGGYWINPGPGNQNWWFAGWLLQRDLSDALTLGAELYAETAPTPNGTNTLAFNAGGIWNLSDQDHVLFSAGRELVGAPMWTYYLAFQLTI